MLRVLLTPLIPLVTKINNMNQDNKGGRPNKAFSEKRKYQVNVKLNIGEQIFLNRKIRESGLSCNDFIRQCIQQSVIKQRLTVEENELLKQLIGIANNLNQITKKANTHGYESAKNEYLFLAEDIDKLIKRLLE